MRTIACGLLVLAIGACERTTSDAPRPAATPGAVGDAARQTPLEPATADQAQAPDPPVADVPVASPPQPTTPTAPPPGDPAPPRIFEEEIAGLRLGMTTAEMLAVAPGLVTDGTVRVVTPGSLTPGPLSYESQSFEDPAGGISVELRAHPIGSTPRVASIDVSGPSSATTRREIAVGAPRRAVKKAYPSAISPIDELWVRFSDDEMLTFTFEAGRVHAILLGPAMDPDDLEE